MSFIKYLLGCIFEFLSPTSGSGFLKEFFIGIFLLASMIATFLVCFFLLNWWLALIITVGGIIVFCLFSIIIEIIVIKIINKKCKNKTDI